MNTRGTLVGVACMLEVALVGCGGSKPADSPSAPAEASPSASVEAAPPTTAKAVEAKAPPAVTATAASDEGPKPTRTPEDILKAPDVLFLFSFNDSEPRAAAEAKCAKKVGDDPKKSNECLAAERAAFPADGHRFKQEPEGKWWWLTVRQNGNRLTTLHKVQVEFGEQTATSITLKPIGKDKGQSPAAVPASVVFEVPNDYQIALKDPKAGRLVFQAKIGVVSE